MQRPEIVDGETVVGAELLNEILDYAERCAEVKAPVPVHELAVGVAAAAVANVRPLSRRRFLGLR